MFSKIWVLIFPLVLFFASAAAAQGTYETTMGNIIANSVDSGKGTPHVINLIWGIALVVGIVFVAQGLIQLIKDTESGSKSGISNGLLKIFGGSLLMSLATVVTVLLNSWTAATNDDGDLARNLSSTGAYVSASSLVVAPDSQPSCQRTEPNPNFDPEKPRSPDNAPTRQVSNIASMDCSGALFANFAKDAAGPLTQGILFLSIIWGLFLVGTGVSRLANSQNPSSQHFEKHSSIIMRIMFGSLAISLPAFMFAVSNSLFGGQTDAFEISFLARNPDAFAGSFSVGDNEVIKNYSMMMGYIFYGLIPFGVFAFVSGLNSFVKASDGQQSGGGGLGAGAVKMVAGILLVNGKIFTCSMASTFGAKVDLIGFCATKIP